MIRGGALVWLLAAVCVQGAPFLEHAPAPGGPWTEDLEATVVDLGGGRYRAMTGLGDAARFLRVADAEIEPRIVAIDRVSDAAVAVEFVLAAADSDGDGVPDPEDLCPGHDDRLDADADGVPDGCDLCAGLPDGVDENGDGAADCAQAPPGMVWIAPGPFQMGDTFAEGAARELPVHALHVSAFFMDRHEVTKALWDEVRAWGLDHAYRFDNVGAGKGPEHPVQTVNWTDAAKWCNARSEKEGLAPVYWTADGRVFRTGGDELRNQDVRWDADGYRLPTEAEWEKAARGGLDAARFPWGDTITHAEANYQSTEDYPYDVSSTAGSHPDYAVGEYPYTAPVGAFAPNGYGLYDMAGNVWEFCWDRYDANWYGEPQALEPDPPGPALGAYRVIRGGSWTNTAVDQRCAARTGFTPVHGFNYRIGLRCARGRP